MARKPSHLGSNRNRRSGSGVGDLARASVRRAVRAHHHRRRRRDRLRAGAGAGAPSTTSSSSTTRRRRRPVRAARRAVRPRHRHQRATCSAAPASRAPTCSSPAPGLDEVNIVTCAVARQLGPAAHHLLRLARGLPRAASDQSGLAPFGIDRVIWPEAQLAADIERIIREPGALDAESFADGAIRLLEYRLDAATRRWRAAASPICTCRTAP